MPINALPAITHSMFGAAPASADAAQVKTQEIKVIHLRSQNEVNLQIRGVAATALEQ